jgi:FtsP/CotA-like multicopper oxidase with cupredoxin domain
MQTLTDRATPANPPVRPPDGRGSEPWLGIGLVVLVAFAVIALIVAVVIAGRGDGSSNGAVSAAGGPATAVTLSEFTIAPEMVMATTNGGLDVTNNGTVAHDLAVDGTDLATPSIEPGKSAHLDLSSLAPGTYTLYCQVAGHSAAGMKAMLHLSAGAGSTAGRATATTAAAMTSEQMDQAMKNSITAFPAKTEGVGAQVLQPTVLADGTKQFELTASVVQWEVSSGKKVEAWTYNGTVPGPTLVADDGDKVAIVLHNNLPESTSIHFHGLQTPNAMDGTTDITQDPVRPGETFTYSFVAHGPAVGMYHSHHDAVKQVPNGLAGAFLVGHQPVPAGVTVAQEQVMILDDSGTISYAINGKSFPATAPVVAKQGEWVEVHYMNEGTQIHPMHLHGMAQVVIAKDGYPLANPSSEDTVTVAPGERYTVLIHATEPGTWVWHCHILPHAENENGMFGMVTALVVQ